MCCGCAEASHRCLADWEGTPARGTLGAKAWEAFHQSQTQPSLCTGAWLRLAGGSEQAAPRSWIRPRPLGQGQRRCGWNLRVHHPIPIHTRASLGFPLGVGRCHGNWVGRGWPGRAATTCQEHVLASLDGLWLWLQASDTWILSAANKSVLWGLSSACGVWPTPPSLRGREETMGPPGWMGLLPSHCSLSLSYFVWSVCLCVF